MRSRGRVDANQAGLVKHLRQLGASVAVTSMVGQGFPDIVVGYRGRCYLFEIKDPTKPPSKRELTPAEKQFRDTWQGHFCVIHTLVEALKEMGLQ